MCPRCGKSGDAHLSDYAGHRVLDDYGTTVDELPEGFKVVKQKSKIGSVDIFCVKCEMSALS